MASTSWSILGMGKGSFGQALFKSVKSMQLAISRFFFLNHYRVGQPLRVEDFLNSFGLLQLVHLCPNCLGVVFG